MEFNFIGSSYEARSLIASCEESINLYLELQPGEAKGQTAGNTRIVLYGTPGLVEHWGLPDYPLRGLYSPDGGATAYAVAGSHVYQLFADGTFQVFGQVALAGTPAQMLANGSQLLIASGDTISLYDGRVMTVVTPGFQIAYIDGYYLAAQQYSAQFNISNLNNGLAWDALDFAVLGGSPDHIQAFLSQNREAWFLNQTHAEIWDDVGNADFPFQRNASGYLEAGCCASWSAQKFTNSLIWLGQDTGGPGVLLQSTGYQVQRVSTPAIEYRWRQYPTVIDAVSWQYTAEGHVFYAIWFPSGDATWVYDLTTQQFHERSWHDPVTGTDHAHRGSCACSAFGTVLVGDRLNGNVYQMSSAYLNDFGGPIKRVRTAPAITNELKRTFYSQLQLDAELGIGPNYPLLDGLGNPRPPQAVLTYSDDGGKTFGNELKISLGFLGQYKVRAIWNRLGASRDRVFRVTVTDPVGIAWVNAYLQSKPGTRVHTGS